MLYEVITLAGQILSRAVLQLEESTREAVTKELVDSLTENINGLPNQKDNQLPSLELRNNFV